MKMIKKLFGSVFNFFAGLAVILLIIAVGIAGFLLATTLMILLKFLAIILVIGCVIYYTGVIILQTWCHWREKKT